MHFPFWRKIPFILVALTRIVLARPSREIIERGIREYLRLLRAPFLHENQFVSSNSWVVQISISQLPGGSLG